MPSVSKLTEAGQNASSIEDDGTLTNSVQVVKESRDSSKEPEKQ